MKGDEGGLNGAGAFYFTVDVEEINAFPGEDGQPPAVGRDAGRGDGFADGEARHFLEGYFLAAIEGEAINRRFFAVEELGNDVAFILVNKEAFTVEGFV